MLHSYLKIALRSLRRHVGYTFITVAGLAVGIACCLLIFLFIRDELSYDRHHAYADRIYRIVSDWGDFSLPATNPPAVYRLRSDFPDLSIGRLLPFDALVRYEDRIHEEDRMFFANPTVFDVFTLNVLRGNPEEVLAKPYTAVVTPEMARKYFGEENPIGKKLTLDGFTRFELEITGLIEPQPHTSHVHYDLLASWTTLEAAFDYANSQNWGNNSIYTYLLLPEGADPKTIEAQFPAFIERHAGDDWNGSELSLQALTDIHLHSHHNMELEPNSNAAYIYVFAIVAAFILVIACINFMNLSTARSEERAKEVGVRKVVGAQRRQLVYQFLAESMLLSVCALVLALLLVIAALPAFRALTGKALPLGVMGEGFTLLALAAVTLLVGLLAGSYPAFFLSSFGPIAVLRGRLRLGTRGVVLRKGLVVFQFATSVCLIIGTLVVYNQLSYLRSASLGFDKEQVVVVPIQVGEVANRFGAFKSALAQQAGIGTVAISSEGLPSELLNGSGGLLEGTSEEEDNFVALRTVSVGHDYFEALGVRMTAGRPFSLDFPTDSSAFVVNETAFRLLNAKLPQPAASPEEVIGKQMRVMGRTGPLIGVVQDFNMSTLHEAIEPILFFVNPDWYSHVLIRVRPGDVLRTMAQVESVWREVYPEYPIEYAFADQAFDAQYRAEERLGQIFTVFASLAVLIACLGLFGLATYTAEQRRKEIGVRKVLGATVVNIVVLLSKDFVRLVLFAFIVAAPLAYLAMHRWLEDFAYRIEIGPVAFLLAGLLAVAIALLTVSYQAIRAALADPVKSLRYE